MIKDPQAVLDYVYDWSDFLEAAETIDSHTITVTSGDVVAGASEVQGEIVRVWIEGGTDGSVSTVTCHIVTDAGREDDLVLTLEIVDAVNYTAAARRIVRALTGYRWTWPPVEVRDVYDVPPNTRFLQLRGQPLIDVSSVTDYDTGDDLEFTVMGSSRIELVGSDVCLGSGSRRRRIDTTYSYGSRPSAIMMKAINTLATEMTKADSDDDTCRIPERVTQISRQGVSWTLIDPMDFLDKGRTGIIEVDIAINSVATKARARPRVFSPEFPPPDRISATVLPYPTGV